MFVNFARRRKANSTCDSRRTGRSVDWLNSMNSENHVAPDEIVRIEPNSRRSRHMHYFPIPRRSLIHTIHVEILTWTVRVANSVISSLWRRHRRQIRTAAEKSGQHRNEKNIVQVDLFIFRMVFVYDFRERTEKWREQRFLWAFKLTSCCTFVLST